MKKILMFLFLLVICLCYTAFGQDIISYQDATATDTVRGVWVSSKTPLPTQKPLYNPTYDEITVTATATQVATSGFVLFRNDSGNIVYFGNSNVTTADGLPLPDGSERSFTLDKNVELYAVASSSSAVRRVTDERP